MEALSPTLYGTRWDKPSFLGEEETMPIYKKSKEDFATSAPPSRFGKLK